jgi:peptide methionine sulfoxide reductase msrA/msrB
VRTALLFAALLAGCTSGEETAVPPGPVEASPAKAAASNETAAPATTTTEGGMKSESGRETVVLAGGCFWGMEELLRKIPGVLETEVGYCGGASTGATYEQVHEGTTGHAEAVRVTFDPAKLAFDDLLRWFFRMHDPTTLNRQGNDRGTQYRSAILWTKEEHAAIAERVKAEIDKSGKWKGPVVTEIRKAGPWSTAEEYHQDYLQKHPDGYTCHFLRD